MVSLMGSLQVGARVTVRRGEGWRETASGPLCHLPALCVTLNLQANVAFLKSCMREFLILLRFLSLKIPKKGLWSVETSTSVQPKVNIRKCCKPQATARALTSVGLYRVSTTVTLHIFISSRLDNIWHCPCLDMCNVSVIGDNRCHVMHVRLPRSNDFTPTLILLGISYFDASNKSVGCLFQKKVRFGYMSSRKGSVSGLICPRLLIH